MQVLETPPPQPTRSFEDINAHKVSLKDFRGKVILLNIWASWCVPCVKELPSLDQFAAQYNSDNFAVIAVSMDRSPIEANVFYQTAKIKTLGLYHDPSFGVSADVGASGIPISIFYDKSGQEILRISGEVDWQSAEVSALLGAVFNAH